ncbi:MAG: ABC transporter permease [Spirochaetaceae bacterium]|jgi:ABC-2 type transport system permease protein|nr:ABC transporter permease [Spirochaetaceae bacterium]
MNCASIVRKEIYGYLISAVFYGTAVFFILFASVWLFYFQRFFAMNTANLHAFFAAFPLAFILVVPAITMRSWAEERKTGTVELLLTMPFSEWDLVLGKFLAAFAAVAVMIAATVPVPLTLIPLGHFDGGVILGEYLGALFLGASAVSLALFLSCCSKNQSVAFLGSAVVLLGAILVSQFIMGLNLPEWLGGMLNFFSLAFHFETFSRGIIDTRDLAFFLLTTVLFLFLTTRVLIYRKWG